MAIEHMLTLLNIEMTTLYLILIGLGLLLMLVWYVSRKRKKNPDYLREKIKAKMEQAAEAGERCSEIASQLVQEHQLTIEDAVQDDYQMTAHQITSVKMEEATNLVEQHIALKKEIQVLPDTLDVALKQRITTAMQHCQMCSSSFSQHQGCQAAQIIQNGIQQSGNQAFGG